MSNVVTQKCGDAGLEFSGVRAHRPRHPAIAFSAVTTQLDRKRLAGDVSYSRHQTGRKSRPHALHNKFFEMLSPCPQSREPETSMVVVIPRRMEPEHAAARLKATRPKLPGGLLLSPG